MVIKISRKPNGSSNKSQTPVQMDDQSVPEPPAHGPDPASLIPFIDKISVVLTVPKEQDAVDIYGSLIAKPPDPQVLKPAPASSIKGYKQRAWRIVIPSLASHKKWPHLQLGYDPTSKLAQSLRIEFSPIDLGLQGMTALHVNLISQIPDGWAYFQEQGRITMIEVTLDIEGIGMEDFHILPAQATASATYKRNGKLETLYLGKSKSNQTKIYDRGQKRISKGQGWSGPPTTRIERRLKLAKPLQLADLGSLPNPFADLKIIASASGCPPEEEKSNKAYLWSLFMDSVRVRNLNASLALLPTKKRAMYRKWLAKHSTSWWQPADIWAHWPNVVAKSALLPDGPKKLLGS